MLPMLYLSISVFKERYIVLCVFTVNIIPCTFFTKKDILALIKNENITTLYHFNLL